MIFVCGINLRKTNVPSLKNFSEQDGILLHCFSSLTTQPCKYSECYFGGWLSDSTVSFNHMLFSKVLNAKQGSVMYYVLQVFGRV